jgi:hypothetical protein
LKPTPEDIARAYALAFIHSEFAGTARTREILFARLQISLGDSLTFLNRVLVGLTAVLVLFAIPVAIDTFRNVLRWFCG